MPETDTSDRRTPQDYDAQDGLVAGVEQCPHCKQSLLPMDYDGTIYAPDGRSYDGITDTDPGDRPFFCDECWPELEANRKANENKSLGEFA